MATKKTALVLVLTWLIFALIFFFGAIFALDGVKYFRLANEGVETQARVTAKEPDNHFFIRYSYTVNGHEYQGIGSAGRGNPDFESIKVGDPFRVFYDPSDPTISVTGNPSVQFASIKRGIAFLTLLGPSFCLFGLWAKGWLPK